MREIEEVKRSLDTLRDLAGLNPSEALKLLPSTLAAAREADPGSPALMAFAAQVEGTVWRANAEFRRAEEAYSRAEEVYREALARCENLRAGHELILGRADLWRRWSFLCIEQRRWQRGLEMLDAAEEALIAARRRHDLGRVHLARGQLLAERNEPGDGDRAIELLAQSVEMIDPNKSEPAFDTAQHNLEWALATHASPSAESLEKAFRALQRSRLSRAAKRPSAADRGRQLFGHRQRTIPDAKRRYLQGKVLMRLRQHDEARPFLETARIDLMLLGNYPRDVVPATVDLVECYLWALRRPWTKVSRLLTETLSSCKVDDWYPEVIRAVQLLEKAIAAKSFEKARRQVALLRRGFAVGQRKRA